MPVPVPMRKPEKRQTLSPAQAVEKAEETIQELRAVLARAGIKLPSLGVDPLTVVRDEPNPLVELGRCTTETAARLVRALQSTGGLQGDQNTVGSRTS